MGAKPLIGGQAVMEGVMMRSGTAWALAVRKADGSIVVERHPWFSLTRSSLLRARFIRGFPVLAETLVNGIRALNRSTAYAVRDTSETELHDWQLILTLLVSVAIAVGLFVVAPHVLAMGMFWSGWSGDVEGVAFHMWDGLFKFAIFVSYLAVIGMIPDIRRVFCYHGAEHKVLGAFEAGGEVSAASAARFSREHPRCGTTFLLFVLSMAILLHTVLVPLLLLLWSPDSFWLKHVLTVLFKLALFVPISSLSYELIHFAARLDDTFFAHCLRAPGLCLQRLTTREPDSAQLEVAVAALAGALEPAVPDRVVLPARLFHADTTMEI